MDGMNDNGAINPSIKDKKTQTFNLIIGIATLIIALLGATFAYFTATARSSEGEVMVKSAMVSIAFDRGTAIKATNLIPSTEKVALSKYQKSMTSYDPGEDGEYLLDFDDFLAGNDHSNLDQYLDRRCVDSQGREVCYVFWFSVTSDGQADESTDILASITVNKNEFDNLSYLVYEVEYERDENGKIINDKYGFGLVRSYRLVSEFVADESAPEEEIPYARFGQVTSIFEDEVLTGAVYPVSCLFGETEDAASKAADDVSRCKPYSITNLVEHNYQIVIWLEETGFEQPEQGKTFNGTVSVEVKGDVGSSSGKITGRE